MWSCITEQHSGGRALKAALDEKGKPLRCSDVLRLWQDNEAFRSFFISQLVAAPFAAFRWETPPVTAASVDRRFEFVLLDSPELSRTPDRNAFASHFATQPAEGIVVFPNLGNDAVLVVPCPIGLDNAYVHIGAFLREAPLAQRHALWQAVGKAMEQRLGSEPVWLSTAGAGVAWLHVRLDSRPKYYGFAPYRVAPQ